MKTAKQIIECLRTTSNDHYLKKYLSGLIYSNDFVLDFFIRNAQDAIWIWDLTKPNNIWISNDFWEKLGIANSEDKRTLFDIQKIGFNLDLINFYRTIRHILDGVIFPGQRTIRFKHNNGQTLHFGWNAIILRNEEHKPIKVVGNLFDHTSKHNNFEFYNLKSQLLLEQELLNNTGSWLINVKSSLFKCNEACANILGYSLKTVKSFRDKNLLHFIAGEQREHFGNIILNHLKGHTEYFECKLKIYKKGLEAWVYLKGKVFICNKDGQPECIIGIIKELDKNDLSDYEYTLNYVTNSANIIAMIDSNYQYIATSSNWLRFFNFQEKLNGRFLDFEKIFGKGFISIKELNKCRLGKNFKRDVKIKRGDESVSISVNINKWDTPTVNGTGLFIEIINKTKLKELKKVKNLLEVTERQNANLKNFAHVVSHDLRSYSSNLEMLMSFIKEEQPKLIENELIQMIDISINNLSNTILNLNEVVLNSFLVKKSFKKINLYNVVEKCVQTLSSYAKSKDVLIKNNLKKNAFVLGVKAYVNSVVYNFVSNAIKYSCPTKVGSYVKIDSFIQDEYLALSVEDNGIGINLDENERHLFGLFKTFHNNNDAKGIGLYIAKNQIEAIGGYITYKSEINKGTSFNIFFQNGNDK